MDQTDVPEVVRHLVSEARPTAETVPARVAQVFLAEAAKILRAHAREYRGILRVAPVQRRHDARHVGELSRAFDLRVRGQNLLDQRGAGAGQADDEDRIPARRSAVSVTGKERRLTDLSLQTRNTFD